MLSDFCARVMPTYIKRRSSSILSLSTLSRCGKMPSSTPIKNTCPNSKPLAAWSVDSLTASGSPSSRPSSILISATICVRFSKSRVSPSPLSPPLRVSQPTKSNTFFHLASAERDSSESYKNASYSIAVSMSLSTSPEGSLLARSCSLLMYWQKVSKSSNWRPPSSR